MTTYYIMKSFAKVSVLFALIITGRYMQPAAPATVATRPAPAATQALPLVLARYTAAPQSQLTVTRQYPPASAYYL